MRILVEIKSLDTRVTWEKVTTCHAVGGTGDAGLERLVLDVAFWAGKRMGHGKDEQLDFHYLLWKS